MTAEWILLAIIGSSAARQSVHGLRKPALDDSRYIKNPHWGVKLIGKPVKMVDRYRVLKLKHHPCIHASWSQIASLTRPIGSSMTRKHPFFGGKFEHLAFWLEKNSVKLPSRRLVNKKIPLKFRVGHCLLPCWRPTMPTHLRNIARPHTITHLYWAPTRDSDQTTCDESLNVFRCA